MIQAIHVLRIINCCLTLFCAEEVSPVNFILYIYIKWTVFVTKWLPPWRKGRITCLLIKSVFDCLTIGIIHETMVLHMTWVWSFFNNYIYIYICIHMWARLTNTIYTIVQKNACRLSLLQKWHLIIMFSPHTQRKPTECKIWWMINSSGNIIFQSLSCVHSSNRRHIDRVDQPASLRRWFIMDPIVKDDIGLAHGGRVTHICVGKLTIIGSDNDLLPQRGQAIIWTNAGILLIWPLGTNFSEILIEIQTFSLRKIRLKMSSAKYCSFRLGLNVLRKSSLNKRVRFRKCFPF